MVAPEELSYLHWLGRTQWDGTTDVIEFGPWLGGTTSALAAGMKRNPRWASQARLHTVDNFIWRPFMGDRAAVRLGAGESFRVHLEENIRQHRDLVVVHEARLPDQGLGDMTFDEPFRASEPSAPLFTADLIRGEVRIVFVDGAKSWRALHYMLDELHLGADALLVLQDFQHWAAWWVPMMTALLWEDGQDIDMIHVLASDTVSLRIPNGVHMKRIPAVAEEIEISYGSHLLRSAVRRVAQISPSAAQKIALAEVVWLGARDSWDEAYDVLHASVSRWRLHSRIAPLEQTILWAERISGRPVLHRRLDALRMLHRASHRTRHVLGRAKTGLDPLGRIPVRRSGSNRSDSRDP